MLIQANISSNKTEFLLEKYFELLNKNISPEKILFLVPNSHKKNFVIDFCKKNKLDYSPINTFQGLIYRTITDNWNILAEKIKIGEDREKPNLCSMELSQYIMNKCIQEVGFNDYFSKINLLHQLFRRYFLILQNDLEEEDIMYRSNILGEVWANDAQKVLNKYEEKTLQYRCFDYLRQMPLFKFIYKNTDYFSKIEYLFLDDADEITQFQLNFLKQIAPFLKEKFVCYDKNGASRTGYLSAKKNIEKDLISIFKEKPISLETENFINVRAEKIYESFISNKKESVEKIIINNFLTRQQMIKNICEKIDILIKKGVPKNEIAIIAPVIDFSLENFLKKYLADNTYEFISGNKKLAQDKTIKNIFSILKLANPEWGLLIEPFEINSLLNNFSNIPLKYCQKIFTEFKKSKTLKAFDFENKKYNERYKNLLLLIEKTKNLSLLEAIKLIQNGKKENQKVNFLIKQISEFEYLFEKKSQDKKIQKNIVKQFECSMIAENSVENEVDTEKIIISTPQKYIDIQKRVKYQFWLDLSAKGWLVEDVGNIYNAWGFQSDWDKNNIDYEKLSFLTKDKTGRMLRKIALLATDYIFAYSCCYDSLGFENLYGISDFINENNQEIKNIKKILPRNDQKEVLNYKEGKLAIAAVPGAGKTTILLALIIKLLEQNIPSENIFVLTYMESAAKHFKEKLMQYCPDIKVLPNISTIHGLCLKILKENSNYVKVNLDPNFQICDELNRKNFIYEALFKSNLKEEEFSKYEKAISTTKLNPDVDLSLPDKNFKIFKRFFDNYNKILYENSMIDYDDMLYYAVKLLEENPQILKSYQKICKYIIEDEAQDSSLLQQKLLNLLAKKNGNLIRCGDPNQAITTTFTSADTKGFIDFIENNKNVKMNFSQRCAKAIYSFANLVMSKYKNSFFENYMKATQFNPIFEKNVFFEQFQQDNDEKNYILNSIKTIFANDKNATIAILLRNNYQVDSYSEFLQSNKINTVQKIDNLKNNKAFNLMLTYFEILEYPYNNKILYEGMKKLQELGFYNFSQEDLLLVKNLQNSFLNQNPDDFNSYELSKFWWDFDYIFSNSNQEQDLLVCLIADYYFNDNLELENAYMLAVFIKSLSENMKKNQSLIEKLMLVKNSSNLGAIHLIKDDKTLSINNSVQIMTIHKSKGDEFDYVFVPEMSSKLFPLDLDEVKIKNENYYCECLKKKEKRKTLEEMKQEQINETLHLIYVAITRAKKQLSMSFSLNIKQGAKNLSCCKIFNLQNICCNEIKNSNKKGE